MGSDTDSATNVPPVNADDKASWPVVGGRVHPDDRKLIDRAALELGLKRGVFLVEAAVEKAKAVLKKQRQNDVAA